MINIILSLSLMFCDIKGEVKNPGVYEINNNNIYEIINLAGGLNKDAYLNNINLSKKVTDEMVIYIPSIKDKPTTCPICVCKVETSCQKEIINTTKPPISTTKNIITTIPTTKVIIKINLNTASKEELISITGIGPTIADNIINYRVDNHFHNIEDILLVKGIGEILFAKIKNFITV
ncbi:MAG: helix-hairpin-helix domain-containing protein [Bacilli bacterium]|nr:helix-hairpin-helix domain-containing protein [Bacilli bacterium]